MEYENLKFVMETDNVSVLNDKLKNGWKLLAIAPGQRENGEAYCLYSLGESVSD